MKEKSPSHSNLMKSWRSKRNTENREIYNDSVEVNVLITGVNTQDPMEVIAERRYVDKVVDMTNSQRKIEAIKMLRADYNLGLKEAKLFTETLNSKNTSSRLVSSSIKLPLPIFQPRIQNPRILFPSVTLAVCIMAPHTLLYPKR